MYVKIDNQLILKSEDIIGIFDLDNTTLSKISRDFLNKKEKEGKTITVGYDLPKSFILTDDGMIYITQVSTATLLKRIQQKIG